MRWQRDILMQPRSDVESSSQGHGIRTMVGGVPVDAYSRSALANKLYLDSLDKSSPLPKLVFSMNGEGVYYFHKNDGFKACVLSADVVHADGMSVIKAGNKFTNTHFPERVATTDLFHDLARVCSEQGLSVFFLGGRESVVMKAYENVKKEYPELKLAGYHHGYFSSGSDDEKYLLEMLSTIKPHIVFVGLGRPRQEQWCIENRHRLSGITWLKTCGGLFDFLSGNSPRAPRWMIDSGLEWLYRLMKEPRRLFWRYLITNIYSLYCYRFKR